MTVWVCIDRRNGECHLRDLRDRAVLPSAYWDCRRRRIDPADYRLLRWYDLDPPPRHWPWRYCWSDIQHLFG